MAPLVLVLVLATHVAARRSEDLTPWKGGGFGMFSTVDSPAGRVVRAEIDTDVGRLPVAIPSTLGAQASAARAAPSTGRLVDLARELGEQWWVVPDVAALAGPGAPNEDEALRDAAADAATRAFAAEAVRAVDPATFDRTSQRRLTVRRVTVTVLRPALEAGGGDTTGGGRSLVLTPTPLRSVTIELGRRSEGGP